MPEIAILGVFILCIYCAACVGGAKWATSRPATWSWTPTEPCAHANRVPVRSALDPDDLLAILCLDCDTQLPATWQPAKLVRPPVIRSAEHFTKCIQCGKRSSTRKTHGLCAACNQALAECHACESFEQHEDGQPITVFHCPCAGHQRLRDYAKDLP